MTSRFAQLRLVCWQFVHHHREDKAFYLLAGSITFYVGDAIYTAHPGALIYLPRQIPHSFTFETETIKMLALLTPGGSDRHFCDQRFSASAQALTLPPMPEAMPDAATFIHDLAAYGIEVVGPPGAPVTPGA